MKANEMDNESMVDLPAEIKQHMTRYKAPPGLDRRIRHMLAQETRGPVLVGRLRNTVIGWLPVGASFACGVLVALSLVTIRADSRGDVKVEQQVVSAHIRSLMADHLMDVASTDRHTVKPWFTGKLDFAPPVVDLASEGFPLIGARLDYVNDRAVAALVYRHDAHVINVFTMPTRGDRTISVSARRQGFQVAQWQNGGMLFWAVSDIGPEEMEKFAHAMQVRN